MISEKLKKQIRDALESKFFKKIEITAISSLLGGCINECYKLKTNAGFFFVKINNACLFPSMFESEAKGLKLLKSTGTIRIPEVVFGKNGENNFLILEFKEERLNKQIEFARDKRTIDPNTVKQFSNLFKRLNELFPEEQPSLLHGDLWSGNYLASPEGDVCLIDPAVYYGFREMDIAMTRLFGGFSP